MAGVSMHLIEIAARFARDQAEVVLRIEVKMSEVKPTNPCRVRWTAEVGVSKPRFVRLPLRLP